MSAWYRAKGWHLHLVSYTSNIRNVVNFSQTSNWLCVPQSSTLGLSTVQCMQQLVYHQRLLLLTHIKMMIPSWWDVISQDLISSGQWLTVVNDYQWVKACYTVVKEASGQSMLYSGQSVLYSGQSMLYSGQSMLYSGQSVLYSGQSMLYSGQSVLYSGQSVLYSGQRSQWSKHVIQWSKRVIQWSKKPVVKACYTVVKEASGQSMLYSGQSGTKWTHWTLSELDQS